MQVSNLVNYDWVFYDASPIDLVQLLNGVLLLKIKAKHSITFFAHPLQSAYQQNLGRGDFQRLKPPQRGRHLQLQKLHFLGFCV